MMYGDKDVSEKDKVSLIVAVQYFNDRDVTSSPRRSVLLELEPSAAQPATYQAFVLSQNSKYFSHISGEVVLSP